MEKRVGDVNNHGGTPQLRPGRSTGLVQFKTVVQLERPDAGCRDPGSPPLPRSPMGCQHAPSFLHAIPPCSCLAGGPSCRSDDKRRWLLAAVSPKYLVEVGYPWEAPCRPNIVRVFPGLSDGGRGWLKRMYWERRDQRAGDMDASRIIPTDTTTEAICVRMRCSTRSGKSREAEQVREGRKRYPYRLQKS